MVRIRCLVGAHAPKKSKASFDGDLFHAPCRGCGRQMVRLENGWSSIEGGQAQAGTASYWMRPIVLAGLILLAAIVALVLLAALHRTQD